MTITFGDRKLEIREWAPGKALLMTRDEGIKDAILEAMEHMPDAIEMLTEPDCVFSPEKDQRFLLGFVAGMVSKQERKEETCCGKCEKED